MLSFTENVLKEDTIRRLKMNKEINEMILNDLGQGILLQSLLKKKAKKEKIPIVEPSNQERAKHHKGILHQTLNQRLNLK